MKLKTLIVAAVTLAATASPFASANHEVIGAVIGGAAGSVIGRDMGGRDGAIIGAVLGAATGAIIGQQAGSYNNAQQPVYYPPLLTRPVYYPAPQRTVYVPQRPVYVPAPVVMPVYYDPHHDHGGFQKMKYKKPKHDGQDNGNGRGHDRHDD
ncbi:MAG: glycine zipper 2TM domain-containing protein [Burkholderiales bacterium]